MRKLIKLLLSPFPGVGFGVDSLCEKLSKKSQPVAFQAISTESSSNH